MHEYFRIAVCLKAMPVFLESKAQLRKIVDLAIEHHGDIARFVVNGLMASGKIDDAEPAQTEDCSRADEHTLIVRSTMDERVHHLSDPLLSHCAVGADYATNAAHEVIPPVGLHVRA